MEKRAETKIKVRYQETDQMGIVYHANYFVWFDIARTEMIREIGITYGQIEEMGLLLPVIDASCQYKNSAEYEDELLVIAKVANYNGVSLEFEYEILRINDNTILATGKTKHVWTDKNHKIVRFKAS